MANIFEDRFKKKIDFNTPETFNEKIISRKLLRNPIWVNSYVDKIKIKSRVKNHKGLYVIPTLFEIRLRDINKEFLLRIIKNHPQGVFIKLNHDSGSVFFIDNSSITRSNINSISRSLNVAMNCNYYWHSREWVYSGIKPRIFIEPNMAPKNEKINDYKLYVFNHKVEFVLIIEEGRRQFFDRSGNRLPFDWARNPNWTISKTLRLNKIPEQFDELIELAEEMSEGFQFVRIDYYIISGKIYFGEYTFFPNDGLNKFDPPEWDLRLGKALDISKPTL